ncbi:MAG: hypothetical protein IKG00_03440 [Lachnospiraceae bacterium]|nr:hypothetical protein [Lachnospiraceae bacterium]
MSKNKDLKKYYKSLRAELEKLNKTSADETLSRWESKESLKNGADIIKERIKPFINDKQQNTNKLTRKQMQELKDIINQIVLWKVNRQVFTTESILPAIIAFGKKEGFNLNSVLKEYRSETSTLIEQMLVCQGIRLPMASTILHFFYPDVFPIIDQRAYRVIMSTVKGTHIEYSDLIKPNTKSAACAEKYLDYLEACKTFYKEQKLKGKGIDFCDLDKFAYQFDIDLGYTIKY